MLVAPSTAAIASTHCNDGDGVTINSTSPTVPNGIFQIVPRPLGAISNQMESSDAPEIGGDAEVAAVMLSSNYRFCGIGRGELTMGNLVGYSLTVDTGITNTDYFTQRNVWVRNDRARMRRLLARQGVGESAYCEDVLPFMSCPAQSLRPSFAFSMP